MLVEALGGQCAVCSSTRDLEIDHVEGITWQHERLNWLDRLRRYVEEFRRGVALRLLCDSCNGARNQHVYGTAEDRRTRDEVIEELERADREAYTAVV